VLNAQKTEEMIVYFVGMKRMFLNVGWTAGLGSRFRNGSGQAHSTVKIPVRNEGGRSARLLILYGVPVVNI
jgi:hypothetical protein